MATSSMRGRKLGLAVEEGEFGAMKSGIAGLACPKPQKSPRRHVRPSPFWLQRRSRTPAVVRLDLESLLSIIVFPAPASHTRLTTAFVFHTVPSPSIIISGHLSCVPPHAMTIYCLRLQDFPIGGTSPSPLPSSIHWLLNGGVET